MSFSLIGRSAALPNASRADRFLMVLPSPGSTSSSRSPSSSIQWVPITPLFCQRTLWDCCL